MSAAPIPQYLAYTIDAMQFRRRAGEWELEPADAAKPSAKLATELLSCLPWASPENFKVFPDAVDVPWQSSANERQHPTEDFGFQADLSLHLHWIGPDGQLGRSSIPGAGRLIYDRDANIVTLTIWPNFFTDSIRVRDDDGMGSTFIDWTRAAELNRQQVAESLRCWTSEQAGSVLSAESELIDGIGIGGFENSAVLLRGDFVSSAVVDLISGYFSEELIRDRPDMRSSLYNGGPGGVAAVRAEFADLLRRRTLSRDELWRATSAWFDNDKQMYGELEDAYRFLFNEEPPVPTSAIDGRLWTTVEPWSPE